MLPRRRQTVTAVKGFQLAIDADGGQDQHKKNNISSPPLPAGSSAAGKGFQPARTANPGDLELIGRRGCTEEVGGLMDLLPGSPNSLLPGNGGCSKSAGIWAKDAPHMLDGMPVRSRNANSGYNVRLEEGEVWEKGPEMITMDGDTIRPTFASSSLDPSSSFAGTGRPGQSWPMNLNAEKTQPRGVLQANHRALDAQMDGPRGGGHATDRAGEAGGHHALSSTVVMLGRPADRMST